MKKTVCIILILLLALLCACGQRTQPDGTVPTPRPGEIGSATVQQPDGAVPASGTDLAIPEPWSEAAQAALDGLRQEMRTQDCVCAVAPLGTVDPTLPLAEQLERSALLQELAEAYPDYAFLPELTPMHCADTGFRTLYCMVPLDENAMVCVQAPGMDDYQGPPGGPVLFASDKASVSISLLYADGSRREFSERDLLAPQPGVLNCTVPSQ